MTRKVCRLLIALAMSSVAVPAARGQGSVVAQLPESIPTPPRTYFVDPNNVGSVSQSPPPADAGTEYIVVEDESPSG